MQVGLISPIAHLEEFALGPFHLLLSHLLEDKKYLKHYQAQAEQGAHLLLDNSAHEHGEGGDPRKLLDQAVKLGAREIVVPDVLWDASRTIERGIEGLDFYFNSRGIIDRHNIQLMMVPQAQTIFGWGKVLGLLVSEHQSRFGDRPFSIGISKDYEVWEGGIPNLINRFVEPLHADTNCEVHLLGWGRELHKLSIISTRWPWIRSTDSAKPFVYALNNIELTLDLWNPEYPRRPEEYFKVVLDDDQLEIARNNVEVFRRRAKC